ncbi:MAG: TIGR03617 family F420-dependent LLM class oxidoreductase [Nitriliruptoraceae bacterium]|nr:TIGR03617 family F420-dependent LLM class oxidoreductase [Nitriliruptoraceae bacterium]
MKLDTITYGAPLAEVGDQIASARAAGYDGWFTSETTHDPLLACAAGGAQAQGMTIGTAIAVAFPRSPMHTAYAAHDLQALTGGRFVLGLGSQIKPHIEKRFSATWSKPAARMREYVLALRAIWDAWADGTELAFRGEFTRHTLMTPFFTPQPHGFGHPAVWLAAVGPLMTRATGEVADGLLAHGFTTRRYLEEVTLPALAEGRELAHRPADAVEVVLPVFVIAGRTEQERTAARRTALENVAFYGSTPAYRGVLDRHGWGDLHEQLHRLSRSDGWARMPELLTDEVVDAFAVTCEPDEIGAAIAERFGGLVDRVSLSTSFAVDATLVDRIRTDLGG